MISLSLLSTAHPNLFQQIPVRASSGNYPTFTLAMDRSPGFGSAPNDSTPTSDSVSLRLPYTVNLAAESNSLTHYTKGTPSLRASNTLAHARARGTIHKPERARHSSCPLTSPKRRRHLRHGALTACTHTVSGSISLPSSGFFSPFPHGTGSLSVDREYLALEDGPPIFNQDNTCPGLLIATNRLRHFRYGAITLYGRPFQTALL